MLQVLTTSMPASSRTSTSSQRFVALGARGVRVGELVDERDRRLPREDGVGVHLLDDDPAVLDASARHDLEAVEELLGLGPAVRLDEADDEVRPARRSADAPSSSIR